MNEEEPKEMPSEAVTDDKLSERIPSHKPSKSAPQPDRWLITPVSYRKDGTEKPAQLIYYKNDEPITKIKITDSNFTELTNVIQARLHPETTLKPEEWHIKIPTITEENPNPDPVLTFNTRSKIFMALPMNQEFLKKFVKSLNLYIDKEPTKQEKMNTWWHRHKIARTFLILISLPVVLAFVYAVGWFQTIGG